MAFTNEVARSLATVTDTGARAVTIGDFAPVYGGINRPASVVLYPNGSGPEYVAMSAVMAGAPLAPIALLGPGAEGDGFLPTLILAKSKTTLNADTATNGWAAPVLTVQSNQEAGDQPTRLGTNYVGTAEYRGISPTQPPNLVDGVAVGGGTVTKAETWGRTGITTNASGQATITHGLGAAPGVVVANAEGTQAYDVVIGGYTATTFTATVVVRSSGAAVGTGITITVAWIAKR